MCLVDLWHMAVSICLAYFLHICVYIYIELDLGLLLVEAARLRRSIQPIEAFIE